MSFILDALKKSESDRQRQSGPALFEVRVASPRQRFPTWALLLAVLLGINLIGLLWYLLRNDAPPAVATMTTTPAEPAIGAAVARTGTDPRFDPPLIEDRSLTMGRAPLGTADTAPSALEAEIDLTALPSIDQAPRDPSGGNVTRGLPTRDSLVGSGTAELPNVALSLHVYDAAPAKRFALIGSQRVVEGDSLPNGMRVEEIVVDGVVMSYRGSRFLVPIQ